MTVFTDADMQRLDSVLTNSPLGLVAWDSSLRISFWSDNAQTIFGWTAAEMIGKDLVKSKIVHPDDLPSIIEVEAQTRAGLRKSRTNVNRNIRKDGSIITCKWFNGLRQADPHYMVVSFVEDITEIALAEASNHESEERFRSLFANNPDVVCIFDRDGKIIDINAASQPLSGGSNQSLQGVHFNRFILPEDRPKHDAYFRKALAGEILRYDATIYSLEGQALDVSLTTVPIWSNGKVTSVYSIIRDQTEQKAAGAALEQSEERLRSLFEENPNPVIAIDGDGLVRAVNDAASGLFGGDRFDLISRRFTSLIAPEDEPLAALRFIEAMEGTAASMLLTTTDAHKRRRELDVTMIPQFSSGDVTGVYVVMLDVTEKRLVERQVVTQAQRIRDLYAIAATTDYSPQHVQETLAMGAQIFNASVGAVVRIVGDDAMIETSYAGGRGMLESGERVFAIARKVAQRWQSGSLLVEDSAVATAILVDGELHGALVFALPEGKERPDPTDLDLLALMAALLGTLIERGRARESLRALAYYDTLTGLPNRVALHEALHDAIESAQRRLARVAVLFIDLDRFKDVNDTLGHALGDRLLELVAGRLVSEIGAQGTVARMGGDEFVVLLPNVRDAEVSRSVAERVVSILSEPFLIDEYEQFVSASVGISIFPEDGRDDQALVKNADIAMYRAKDRGRNGFYFYNPALEAPIHLRLSQEKLLRRALEREQFSVHYQPQIDLRTGDVVAVEALLRWEDPKTGLIEPRHFIPSAEISGLIVPLGEWVLTNVTAQMARWRSTLGPLRVAINLSGRQFHQRNLVQKIISACSDASIDPSLIELEITETVAMSDADHTVSTLRQLKDAGMRLAVDDFGTGYSSLAYLRRFALDVMKIDRSFITGVGTSSGNESIVSTLITMAHNLGLETIAEGVEEQVEFDWLAAHQCDMIQGFLIAPALPVPEFERFMQERRLSQQVAG